MSRSIIFGSIRYLFILIFLLPLIWTLGNFLSTYQIEWLSFYPPKLILNYVENLGPNFFVNMLLVHIISAVILWHIVFWPIIAGSSSSKFLRTLSKATDYFWYSIGALVVVLIFHDYQIKTAAEARRFSEMEANRLQAEWAPQLPKTKEACTYIKSYENKSRDGVEWAMMVCNQHITDDDLDMGGISDTCQKGEDGGDFYPSNDSRFSSLEGEARQMWKSLQQIHYHCFIHVHFDRMKQAAQMQSDARANLARLPTFEGSMPDPRLLMFYMAFFALAIGAKLSKTTVDVTTEWRKKYGNRWQIKLP